MAKEIKIDSALDKYIFEQEKIILEVLKKLEIIDKLLKNEGMLNNQEKKQELICERAQQLFRINILDDHTNHMRVLAELYSQVNILFRAVYEYDKLANKYETRLDKPFFDFLRFKNQIKDFLMQESKFLDLKVIISKYKYYGDCHKEFFNSFVEQHMNNPYVKPTSLIAIINCIGRIQKHLADSSALHESSQNLKKLKPVSLGLIELMFFIYVEYSFVFFTDQYQFLNEDGFNDFHRYKKFLRETFNNFEGEIKQSYQKYTDLNENLKTNTVLEKYISKKVISKGLKSSLEFIKLTIKKEKDKKEEQINELLNSLGYIKGNIIKDINRLSMLPVVIEEKIITNFFDLLIQKKIGSASFISLEDSKEPANCLEYVTSLINLTSTAIDSEVKNEKTTCLPKILSYLEANKYFYSTFYFFNRHHELASLTNLVLKFKNKCSNYYVEYESQQATIIALKKFSNLTKQLENFSNKCEKLFILNEGSLKAGDLLIAQVDLFLEQCNQERNYYKSAGLIVTKEQKKIINFFETRIKLCKENKALLAERAFNAKGSLVMITKLEKYNENISKKIGTAKGLRTIFKKINKTEDPLKIDSLKHKIQSRYGEISSLLADIKLDLKNILGFNAIDLMDFLKQIKKYIADKNKENSQMSLTMDLVNGFNKFYLSFKKLLEETITIFIDNFLQIKNELSKFKENIDKSDHALELSITKIETIASQFLFNKNLFLNLGIQNKLLSEVEELICELYNLSYKNLQIDKKNDCEGHIREQSDLEKNNLTVELPIHQVDLPTLEISSNEEIRVVSIVKQKHKKSVTRELRLISTPYDPNPTLAIVLTGDNLKQINTSESFYAPVLIIGDVSFPNLSAFQETILFNNWVFFNGKVIFFKQEDFAACSKHFGPRPYFGGGVFVSGVCVVPPLDAPIITSTFALSSQSVVSEVVAGPLYPHSMFQVSNTNSQIADNSYNDPSFYQQNSWRHPSR